MFKCKGAPQDERGIGVVVNYNGQKTYFKTISEYKSEC